MNAHGVRALAATPSQSRQISYQCAPGTHSRGYRLKARVYAELSLRVADVETNRARCDFHDHRNFHVRLAGADPSQACCLLPRQQRFVFGRILHRVEAVARCVDGRVQGCYPQLRSIRFRPAASHVPSQFLVPVNGQKQRDLLAQMRR